MARRGRVLLVAALLAIAVVVLVLLGFFPQELLRHFIEKRLQSGLGAGSSIKQLHTVPGRLRTDVEDVVIQGPTYKLRVPRARVVLAPGFLFGQALSFESIEITSPTLEVTPSKEAGPASALKQSLVIHHLVVADGTIVYHLGPHEQLTLDGLSLRGAVGEGTLDVAATGGTWQRANTVALGPISGRLRVSSRLDIAIDTLKADALHSHVEVAGTLGRVGAIDPDLRVQARIDLRDLKELGIEADVSGRVTAAGRLSGTGQALTLDAKVQGGQLRISSLPVDDLDAHLVNKGGLEGRTDVSLRAALLGGRTEGEVRLRGSRTNADLKFSGIEVARLRQAGFDVSWPPSGRVAGTLRASGDWQATLQVNATVETAGVSAGDMALQARLDASGGVAIRTRTVDV